MFSVENGVFYAGGDTETYNEILDVYVRKAPEKADEIVTQIIEACDSFDGDEVSIICDESSKYSLNGKPLKSLLDEIRPCADDFEYASASEKASAILS